MSKTQDQIRARARKVRLPVKVVGKGRIDLTDWGLPLVEEAVGKLASRFTSTLEGSLKLLFAEAITYGFEEGMYSPNVWLGDDKMNLDQKKPLRAHINLPFGAGDVGPTIEFDLEEMIKQDACSDLDPDSKHLSENIEYRKALAKLLRKLATDIDLTLPDERG